MTHVAGRRSAGWVAGLALALGAFVGCPAAAAPPPPAVPGYDRLTAEAKADAITRGQLLLGELNCLRCHKPEANERVQLRPAPDLSAVGSRVTPQWLSAYLADPQAAKPGTAMPNVFHASAPAARDGAVEALAHYLASLGGPLPPATEEGTKLDAEAGEKLFHSVGCVACHAPVGKEGKPLDTKVPSVPLGDLASKTTVDALAAFLREPHKARPSGRMPSLYLSPQESRSLAVYLLRDQLDNPQTKDAAPVAMKGLKVTYWETDAADARAETLDKLPGGKPAGRATTISAKIPGTRQNGWAARFTGAVKVPRDGRYTFILSSDDGSRLYVGGKQLINNDGVHANTEKRGQVELTAGTHPFAVTYFQGAGEAELKVEWAGPGMRRQAIPADALVSVDGKPMVPTGTDPAFAVDPQKAGRGRQMFSMLGCASCHAVPGQQSMRPYKPLAAVNVDAADGCLSPQPRRAVPNYYLSDGQREALKAAIKSAADLAKPLDAKEQVTHAMAALNCYACHKRDAAGGPTDDRQPYFTMTAEFDMGEEGRIPPHLTNVGGKLKPEAIDKIVTEAKLHVRPALATRMPQFTKATAGGLVAALPKADAATDAKAGQQPPAFSEPLAKDGRVLMGVRGLGCVNCHGVLGNKSLGMPAPDLTTAHERLRYGWYNALMHDPNAVNPGTRMPGYWPGDVVPIPKLGGDTAQGQIDALYNYVALGTSMALPAGLAPTGKTELTPTEEPILHRTFFAGVGPRTVLVGYPEQLNVAFDANLVRLATVWRGRFFDTKGMWDGRGGSATGPLGTDVVSLPALGTFAFLPDPAAPWPRPIPDPADGKVARNLGGRFLGYDLDKERRPTFRYKLGDVEVREQPLPRLQPGGAQLTRKFELAGKAADLHLLAAVGKAIEPKSPTEFVADGKVTVRLKGFAADAKAVVRDGGDGTKQLVVPVRLDVGKATFEVEISW